MNQETAKIIKQILSKFPKHELLWLKTKIINSTDKGLIGKHGIVINETKNMIQIRQNNNKEIWVEKKNSTFNFAIEKQRLLAYLPIEKQKQNNLDLKKEVYINVNGKLIAGRTEERIKKSSKFATPIQQIFMLF